MRAEVAEAEDAAAVRDDDDLDVVAGPVVHHGAHEPAVLGGEVHAARAPEVAAEALAHLAHRRRVDDGRELVHVVDQQPVEERLVAVAQVVQELCAVQRVRQLAHRVQDLGHLLRQRQRARRHEPADAQHVALRQREARALVRQRVVHLRAARKRREREGGAARRGRDVESQARRAQNARLGENVARLLRCVACRVRCCTHDGDAVLPGGVRRDEGELRRVEARHGARRRQQQQRGCARPQRDGSARGAQRWCAARQHLFLRASQPNAAVERGRREGAWRINAEAASSKRRALAWLC